MGILEALPFLGILSLAILMFGYVPSRQRRTVRAAVAKLGGTVVRIRHRFFLSLVREQNTRHWDVAFLDPEGRTWFGRFETPLFGKTSWLLGPTGLPYRPGAEDTARLVPGLPRFHPRRRFDVHRDAAILRVRFLALQPMQHLLAVEFEGVTNHVSGIPDDVARHLHPLAGRGLVGGGVHEIVPSAWSTEGTRHFVLTPASGTLEVLARSYKVLEEGPPMRKDA